MGAIKLTKLLFHCHMLSCMSSRRDSVVVLNLAALDEVVGWSQFEKNFKFSIMFTLRKNGE